MDNPIHNRGGRSASLGRFARASVPWLFLAAILGGGCGRSGSQRDGGFIPATGGFGFGQHSKETYPGHRAIWADVEYRETNGVSTVVWPYLHAVEYLQVNNNITVFLGDRNWRYRNGSEGLVPRVIAFEAPSGPPMDITEQLLTRWSSQSGVEFTNISMDSLVELTRTNDALRLYFSIVKRGLRGPGTIDSADGTATFSWADVREIMGRVRREGKLKKESSSGVEYMEIEPSERRE